MLASFERYSPEYKKHNCYLSQAHNDLDVPAAGLDVEYAIQALRPGHGGALILAISNRPFYALSRSSSAFCFDELGPATFQRLEIGGLVVGRS